MFTGIHKLLDVVSNSGRMKILWHASERSGPIWQTSASLDRHIRQHACLSPQSTAGNIQWAVSAVMGCLHNEPKITWAIPELQARWLPAIRSLICHGATAHMAVAPWDREWNVMFSNEYASVGVLTTDVSMYDNNLVRGQIQLLFVAAIMFDSTPRHYAYLTHTACRVGTTARGTIKHDSRLSLVHTTGTLTVAWYISKVLQLVLLLYLEVCFTMPMSLDTATC